MTPKQTIYDAAVVGAGIVGLATALALSKAGRRVALIERTPPVRMRGDLGFDLRTVALAPASVDFLRTLGGLDDEELFPIDAMHVWEYDGAGSLRFTSDGALAHVAENSSLARRLWVAAEDRLQVFAGSPVTAMRQSREAVTLAGPEVSARLVIGADGADSAIRQLTGTRVRYEPSDRRGPQRAVATIARASRPHGNVAFQRFGRTGPVALLPLTDNTESGASADGGIVSVIWSASEVETARLQALDDDAFRVALDSETEGLLGGFVAVDRRLTFPIRQALTADFNPASRILFVGDAARTLHPLAGQGVNVGLEDACAVAAHGASGDLGATGRWRAFARDRRLRSKLMMASMRALLAAYCGPHANDPWMRLARNASVRFVDRSVAVKAQLIREAMGIGPLGFERGTPAVSLGEVSSRLARAS